MRERPDFDYRKSKVVKSEDALSILNCSTKTSDTWTTIDFLLYILFFVAWALRLTCIPGFFNVWDTSPSGLPHFNGTILTNSVNDYFGNKIWETTDENCPLYFDNSDENLRYLRYSQYFYIAAFILATIRTLELCTASKHLGSG